MQNLFLSSAPLGLTPEQYSVADTLARLLGLTLLNLVET
jgi:hypothetical protein